MSSIDFTRRRVVWTDRNGIGLTEDYVRDLVAQGYEFIDRRKTAMPDELTFYAKFIWTVKRSWRWIKHVRRSRPTYEEMIMVWRAVEELQKAAYGAKIKAYLRDVYGVRMSLGNLYFCLGYLEIEQKIISHLEPGGPERGNRPKKVWEIIEAPPVRKASEFVG